MPKDFTKPLYTGQPWVWRIAKVSARVHAQANDHKERYIPAKKSKAIAESARRRVRFYENIEKANNPEKVRKDIHQGKQAALANSDPMGLERLGKADAELNRASIALAAFKKPIRWSKADAQEYSELARNHAVGLRHQKEAKQMVDRLKAEKLKQQANPEIYVDRVDDPAPFPIVTKDDKEGVTVRRDTITVAKRVQNDTLKRMRARGTIENHHVEAGEILMTLVEQSQLAGGSAWSDTSIQGTGGSRDIIPAAVEAVSEFKRIRRLCHDSSAFNTMLLVIYHQTLSDIAISIHGNNRARAMADVSCVVRLGLDEVARVRGLVGDTRYGRSKSIIRNYQNLDAGDGVEGDWAVSVDPAFRRRKKGGRND